jgi:hypothetical protein
MVPWVRFGLFSVGISIFLDQAMPLLSDAQFTWGERRVMGLVAVITLGGFAVAGWLAARLLKTAAELIDVIVDGVEATERTAELLERHMVPALNRAAAALERSQPAPRDDALVRAAQAVRRAIQARRFDQAERLIQAFRRDHPGAADADALALELDEARRALIDELRNRLESARQSDNLAGVIDARDALTEHLRGSLLQDLDRQVVRWLMDRIQERVLRSGAIDPELVGVSARVADSFGDTDEGAKLRAGLPQLRRRAGLCPRCARPYRGREPLCPDCAGGVSTPAASDSQAEVGP